MAVYHCVFHNVLNILNRLCQDHLLMLLRSCYSAVSRSDAVGFSWQTWHRLLVCTGVYRRTHTITRCPVRSLECMECLEAPRDPREKTLLSSQKHTIRSRRSGARLPRNVVFLYRMYFRIACIACLSCASCDEPSVSLCKVVLYTVETNSKASSAAKKGAKAANTDEADCPQVDMHVGVVASVLGSVKKAARRAIIIQRGLRRSEKVRELVERSRVWVIACIS